MNDVLDSFVTENVARITTITPDMINKMESTVRVGVEAGESTAKLRDRIQNQFGVARNQAQLIAVDQIAKLNGKLTEFRHQEAGVRRYIWSDSDDSRVRRRHQTLDETVQSWKRPPVSGTRGERLHPGQPVRCRCVAIPIFEGFN